MKPTHRLKGLNKVTGQKAVLGAGWESADGSITIVLDPFIKLEASSEWVFTLFPIDK